MEHDLLSPSQEPVLIPEQAAVQETPLNVDSAVPKNTRLFFYGILATAAAVFIIGGTIAVYARAFSDEWAARVASVAPFPAAFVSGRPVWLGNFLFEYKGMRTYYNQNASGALTEEDDASLRKNVLDALVRRVIVNRIALDESVYLTEEAVESAQAGMIPSDTPAEKLAEDVDRLFGWDVEAFRDHLVRPVALEKFLNERLIMDRYLQEGPRKQIDNAFVRLQRGEAFAEVAKSVNEAGSVPEDGAIGKVSVESLPSEVAAAINGLKDGEYSPIVEIGAQNDWAFYIIRMNGQEEKDAKLVVDLSVIRVKKMTLDDLVNQKLERAVIWRIVS